MEAAAKVEGPGMTNGELTGALHYPWTNEALEMLREMDPRYRAEMILDAEVCARCLGAPAVTPYAISEARCAFLDD
jgi:hypothetical protein